MSEAMTKNEKVEAELMRACEAIRKGNRELGPELTEEQEFRFGMTLLALRASSPLLHAKTQGMSPEEREDYTLNLGYLLMATGEAILGLLPEAGEAPDA